MKVKAHPINVPTKFGVILTCGSWVAQKLIVILMSSGGKKNLVCLDIVNFTFPQHGLMQHCNLMPFNTLYSYKLQIVTLHEESYFNTIAQIRKEL